MAVWDRFLTEDDRSVLAARAPRQRSGFGASPALLVIDMQHVACGDDLPIVEQVAHAPGACGTFAWAAIRHLEKLVPAARAAGVPVVYSKHLFRPTSGLPGADASSPYSVLHPASEIPNQIAMQPGDLLVEKQAASAFFHTNLVNMLRNLGVDTLLVAGNSTSGCVRATVVDGREYLFTVAVIEECVFDRIELSHAASLFDLQFKYCDVVSVNDIHGYLHDVGIAKLTSAAYD